MKAAHRRVPSLFRGWRRWAWAALALALTIDAALMLRIATAGPGPTDAAVKPTGPPRKGTPVATTGGTGDRSFSPDAPATSATPGGSAAASVPVAEPDPAAAGNPGDEVDPAALAALAPRELPDALARIARLSPDARDRAMRMLKRRLEGSAGERTQLLALVLTLADEASLDLLAQALLWRLEIPASPKAGAEQMFAIFRDGGPDPRRRAAAVALRRYCMVQGDLEAGRLIQVLRQEDDPGILSDLGFALVNRSDPIPDAMRKAHVDALEEVAARIPGGADRRRMLVGAWSKHEPESGPLESDLNWLQRIYGKWSVSPVEMREDAAAAFAEVAQDHQAPFDPGEEPDPAISDEVLQLHLQVYRASTSAETRLTLFRSVLQQEGGGRDRRQDLRSERFRSFLSSLAAVENDPRRSQLYRRIAESADPSAGSPDWQELWRVFEPRD